jgi:hypothetical protein
MNSDCSNKCRFATFTSERFYICLLASVMTQWVHPNSITSIDNTWLSILTQLKYDCDLASALGSFLFFRKARSISRRSSIHLIALISLDCDINTTCVILHMHCFSQWPLQTLLADWTGQVHMAGLACSSVKAPMKSHNTEYGVNVYKLRNYI